MILTALVLVQSAAAAQTPPDIELSIDATVRRVRIERRGEASLEVTGGEGSIVRVEAPQANGRRTLRNVSVRVRGEARVTEPSAAVTVDARENDEAPETPQPE